MKAVDIMRRTLTIVLTLTLIFTFTFTGQFADKAYAAEGLCSTLTGENEGANEYAYDQWAEPIRSYLVDLGDKLMRVQASSDEEGKFQVSYYDPETYMALSRKTINTPDTPIFGGFANYGGYYYVVTGHTNWEENNSQEVVRITKYDTNWNQVSYASLKGANTVVPFEAGSLRFAFSGNYMVIRTAHKMYASDGVNHQSNLTILYNMSTNKITDSYSKVWNISSGYVSHSFNQFVGINSSGNIIAVDHGDANPRSIVLLKYPTNVSSGTFTSNNVTNTTIMSIAGSKGANYTGVNLGGMAEDSSAYYLAGCSVPQDSNMTSYNTKNIFVTRIDKNGTSYKTVWVTNKAEGETTVNNPHIIKTNGLFMVLWNEGNTIYYNFINSAGNVYNCDNNVLGYGYLSDCVPIFTGSKIIWYTYDDNEETFYEVDTTRDTLKLQSFKHTYEHNHVYNSTDPNGYATMICSDCGHAYTALVPTDFTVSWKTTGYYYDEQIPKPSYQSTLYYDYSLTYDSYDYNYERLSDMVLEANDPANCHVDQTNKAITFDKAGTYSFTAYPKYNPNVRKSYTVEVGEPLSKVTLTADKTSVQPGETIKLSAVAEGGSGIDYSFHAYTTTYGYESYYETIRAAEASNSCEWIAPSYSGSFKVKVLAQDTGGDWSEAEDSITVTVKYQSSSDSGSDNDSGTVEPGYEDSGISLVKYDASVSKISSRVYTGKRIKPLPIVKCFGVTLVKDRDYTISYKNNKNVGTAKVIITGTGSYSGSITKTFKINPKGSSIKSLTGKKKAIKVVLSKRSTKMSKNRITGYQIQYSTSSKFKSAKKIKVKGYKSTTYTIKKLKAKKKYYVRVRTYMKVGNNTYYSKWSAKKSIKTK